MVFDYYDQGIEYLQQLSIISKKLAHPEMLPIIEINRSYLQLLKQIEQNRRIGWAFALRSDTERVAKESQRLQNRTKS